MAGFTPQGSIWCGKERVLSSGLRHLQSSFASAFNLTMSSATAIAWLLLVAVISTLHCTDEFGKHSTSLPDGRVPVLAAKAEVERHIRQVAGADFDARVAEFVRKEAKDIGRTVDWYDAYGKHWHLQESPQYKKYRVRAHVYQVHYQSIRHRTEDEPKTVFSQWYHNEQPHKRLPQKIERSTRKTHSYSWTVEKNLQIRDSLIVSTGLPRSLGVRVNKSVSLDLRKKNTETKYVEETFTIAFNYTIQPESSLKIEWIISDRQIEIPWEAEVILDGWIAVWFETKYDGHWLWFYPIGTYLGGGDFERRAFNRLVYRTKGTFRGIIGAESVVRVKQYPLIETKMRYGHEEEAIFQRLPLKTYVKYLQANGQAVEDKQHGDIGD